MVKSLTLAVFIIAGLLEGRGCANETTCKQRGLLPCRLTVECYSQDQRCDGSADCTDRSDEADCTTGSSVTREGGAYKGFSKGQNLAWLVTPVLLLLGAAYGIYKCVKDGVCAAIKMRVLHGRRNRESRASDYHPLHQVSFYTSTQIPCTQLGLTATTLTPAQLQRMMVVHNQSFSISIPGGEGEGEGGPTPGASLPPSYEEAMSAVSDGKGGTIVMTRAGHVINIPNVGILPPPYAAPRPPVPPGPAPHMDPIEEVSERDEDEEEEDLNGADEETFFLPKDSHGDGNVGGRRRHNSQWSNKRRQESRRRHHSCPS